MAKTARERLAQLLDDAEPAGSFSAQLLAPAHMLELEVSGVGRVRLPVRAPLAKKLIAVTRPAMFGRGEETLTDTSVRDTWELTPDQITLDGPGWTALLDGALEHFRDELGLPRTSRLRAEPHSMLVYGARDSSSSPTRTRRSTTRWWARWWCHCRRRTSAGNWSSTTPGKARPTARRRTS